MFVGKARLLSFLAIVFAGLIGTDDAYSVFGQTAKHTLTPAEDVGLTLFYQYGEGGVPSGGDIIKYSPDHR